MHNFSIVKRNPRRSGDPLCSDRLFDLQHACSWAMWTAKLNMPTISAAIERFRRLPPLSCSMQSMDSDRDADRTQQLSSQHRLGTVAIDIILRFLPTLNAQHLLEQLDKANKRSTCKLQTRTHQAVAFSASDSQQIKMALTNYNMDTDLFAPFFGCFPGGSMVQRSGNDSRGARGIPLDVIEVTEQPHCHCM